jgi:hypothetical protein
MKLLWVGSIIFLCATAIADDACVVERVENGDTIKMKVRDIVTWWNSKPLKTERTILIDNNRATLDCKPNEKCYILKDDKLVIDENLARLTWMRNGEVIDVLEIAKVGLGNHPLFLKTKKKNGFEFYLIHNEVVGCNSIPRYTGNPLYSQKDCSTFVFEAFSDNDATIGKYVRPDDSIAMWSVGCNENTQPSSGGGHEPP